MTGTFKIRNLKVYKMAGGELIVDGTVKASALNTSDINASKTLTVGAMTDAAAATILNSNVQVGGRNLLRRSYYQQTTTADGITCTNNGDGSVTINGTTTATPTVYYFNDSSASSRGHVTLEAGTYTLSGCPDGGSDGTWRLDIYGIPTSSGTVAAVDYGDGVTFTTTGGTPTTIRMRFPSGITLNDFTVWPKLEKGNKATDWTPAPEDVDSDISNAAQTATSYVTDITGGGIMVHPSGDQNTGVRITSDVDIRQGNGQDNVSIANFGALDSNNNPTARVGKADDYHVSIDTDSLDVMDATTTLASFGSEVSLGPTNSNHIRIGTMTNGSKGLSLRSAGVSDLEMTSREFFSPWSTTPFTFNMQGGNQSIDFKTSGVEVWALGDPVESNYAKAVLKLNATISTANQVGSFTFQTNSGSNTWSTPPGTILWSGGGWVMTAGHTANLKYNVSTCPTGIVLHFQPYTSSTVQNYNHTYYFVPKTHVASYNSTGVVVRLGNPDFTNIASKYLYISNDHITGHAVNNTTGTNSGITYNNGTWVMTQVIAV